MGVTIQRPAQGYLKRIVAAFSEASGRKNIPKGEWQRIGNQVRNLLKKGYTESDIINAINYAKDNVKDMYGFGIVGYVIDRANADKPKVDLSSTSLLDLGVVHSAPIQNDKPEWAKVNME
jgi:hypothetical protein